MKSIILGLALLLAAAGPAAAADPVAATQIDLQRIKNLLAGTWQSNDDTRFTRELSANGTVIDRYEGDESATISGKWLLLTGDAFPADRRGQKPPADAIFLQLVQNGDGMLLNLTGVDLQTMHVVNVASGKTTTYMRLK